MEYSLNTISCMNSNLIRLMRSSNNQHIQEMFKINQVPNNFRKNNSKMDSNFKNNRYLCNSYKIKLKWRKKKIKGFTKHNRNSQAHRDSKYIRSLRQISSGSNSRNHMNAHLGNSNNHSTNTTKNLLLLNSPINLHLK